MNEFLLEIAFYAGFLLGIFVLYAFGNVLFGKKTLGGKRLVLFVVGLVMGGMGGGLIYLIPEMNRPFWSVILGLFFLIGSALFLFTSVFGSNKKVNKTFYDSI